MKFFHRHVSLGKVLLCKTTDELCPNYTLIYSIPRVHIIYSSLYIYYELLSILIVLFTVCRSTLEDGSSSGSDDETESMSESDSSTSGDENSGEDGIPVSATQGDGVDLLWDRVQEKVMQATNNKHVVFTVPADGPQLR